METVFDEIIENKSNKDKLKSTVCDKNTDIILECIKLNCEKGNEVLKILFENGLEQEWCMDLVCFELAIKYLNIDALRLFYTLVFPGQYADFKTFSNFSESTGDHPRRHEALEVLLQNSTSIQVWHRQPSYFRSMHTPTDIFMLANHGACFNYSNFLTKIVITAPKQNGHYICVNDFGLKYMCAYEICGLKSTWGGEQCSPLGGKEVTGDQFVINQSLVFNKNLNATRIIMESGFRSIFARDGAEKELKNYGTLKDIKLFNQMYSRKPLSLQRLAADVIRKELQPNAIIGSRILAETGELSKEQASYIIFDLTTENVEQVLSKKLKKYKGGPKSD